MMWENWGLGRCLVWWLTGGNGDRKVMWLSTEGSGYRKFVWRSTNATCDCQVPYGDRSHLFRLAAVLGSWNTALHTFSLGSKRPRQVFNASPSAGGLKCPPRETCQPHIAVGWQVIEKFAKPKGYWSKPYEDIMNNVWVIHIVIKFRLTSLIR